MASILFGRLTIGPTLGTIGLPLGLFRSRSLRTLGTTRSRPRLRFPTILITLFRVTPTLTASMLEATILPIGAFALLIGGTQLLRIRNVTSCVGLLFGGVRLRIRELLEPEDR